MRELTHEGITQPIREWALDYGIPTRLISDRLRRGWTVDKAITTPMNVAPGERLKDRARRPSAASGHRRRLEHAGRSLSVAQWAEHTGISYHTLANRLRAGWPVGKALTKAVRPYPNRHRGVVCNFPPVSGTGAGSTAQETPEITFSEEANS
ncbi:hypothetical protein [Bosea beijingensis]|uniref:hypothetical protein n=1 Tax=Bosea beijingensis TaxID=3068632 RepID=UPI0027412833|nr:hypothetical protein [Bosea sp. REN20]